MPAKRRRIAHRGLPCQDSVRRSFSWQTSAAKLTSVLTFHARRSLKNLWINVLPDSIHLSCLPAWRFAWGKCQHALVVDAKLSEHSRFQDLDGIAKPSKRGAKSLP